MKQWNKILLSAVTLCLFGTASAMISVSPVIIDAQQKSASARNHSEDVRVFNHGQQIAYVKITPKLVENPGTKKEKQVEIKNPEKLGLLVSPTKLMIPPGQFKMVRFVFTKKPATNDRIYRVDIQPVSGSLLLPKTAKEEVGIKLLVGYAVLVIQRPVDSKPKILVNRNGKTVTMKNAGNTNAIMISGKQCNSNGDDCKELATQRLYVGNTWQFKAPYNTPINYQAFYGDNYLTVKSK